MKDSATMKPGARPGLRYSRLSIAGTAIGLVIHIAPAAAIGTNEMTAEERALLPKWCNYAQSFDREPGAPGHYNDYRARYGPGWSHVHHYCFALASLVRQNQASNSAQYRRFLGESAIRDLDYVLRNAPADFFMRYEILYRKARVLIAEKTWDQANAVAAEMIKLAPERADGHGLVAEVLLGRGRPAEARKVLDAATKQVEEKERLAQIRTLLKL